MDRRVALAGLAATGAAFIGGQVWSRSARAPRRIGWLYPGAATRDVTAFVAFSTQMRALGYAEGRDIVYELRGTDGQDERRAVLGITLPRAVLARADEVIA